jgi:arylsulfatase A-like enzyme
VRATRRQFIAGAGAAGAALYLGEGGFSKPQADGPNILLVVLDSLRADHALGPRARTPTIDALARTAARFPNAFPEAMPTVPARNSLLSGRRMFPFREWRDRRGLIAKPGWEPLDRLDDAFTTTLWRAGWWTAYVTDNPFLGFSSPYEPFRRSFDAFIRHGGQIGGGSRPVERSALDHWLHPAVRAAGMAERVRRYVSNANYSNDEAESFAARVFRSAADVLRTAARRQPFLLVADSFQPHEPWTPPRHYVDMYGDPDYPGREPAMPYYGRAENWLDEDELPLVLERMRALYAAEVTMTDRWIGVLLERLHELGLERDTIVGLVSDHGILLGERGWTGKISTELHPELINVPLLVVDPNDPAGSTSGFFASTHDLAPTLLSMAGVERPPAMEGVDLSRVFRGGALPARPYAYGGYSNSHFVRDGRLAYMADNRGERAQLFDVRDDPRELTDIAGARPADVRRLSAVARDGAGGTIPWYDV